MEQIFTLYTRRYELSNESPVMYYYEYKVVRVQDDQPRFINCRLIVIGSASPNHKIGDIIDFDHPVEWHIEYDSPEKRIQADMKLGKTVQQIVTIKERDYKRIDLLQAVIQ